MTNFDKNSYLGVWYEYSNVFEIFQLGNSITKFKLIRLSGRFATIDAQFIKLINNFLCGKTMKKNGGFTISFRGFSKF